MNERTKKAYIKWYVKHIKEFLEKELLHESYNKALFMMDVYQAVTYNAHTLIYIKNGFIDEIFPWEHYLKQISSPGCKVIDPAGPAMKNVDAIAPYALPNKLRIFRVRDQGMIYDHYIYNQYYKMAPINICDDVTYNPETGLLVFWLEDHPIYGILEVKR